MNLKEYVEINEIDDMVELLKNSVLRVSDFPDTGGHNYEAGEEVLFDERSIINFVDGHIDRASIGHMIREGGGRGNNLLLHDIIVVGSENTSKLKEITKLLPHISEVYSEGSEIIIKLETGKTKKLCTSEQQNNKQGGEPSSDTLITKKADQLDWFLQNYTITEV